MSVSNKTSDVNYVDKISDALKGGQDKFEIGKYLQNQGGFNILEIGPGGGQALEKAVALSEGWHRTDKYFVIDINLNILENLKLNSAVSEWQEFYFVKADAMALPFKDESFDMINLSAVAHECSSYGGGEKGFSELAKENSRVLKKSGVLIFRDLEGVNLYNKNKCQLKDIASNGFFRIFFRKFIDRKYSKLSKPEFYDFSEITIFLDNSPYDVKKYFEIYNRYPDDTSIAIEAPIGMIREIQRHFITFIDAYLPEYFYEVTKSLDDSNDFVLRFQKNSSTRAFLRYCSERKTNYYQISKYLFLIKKNDKILFDEYISTKFYELYNSQLVKVDKIYIKSTEELLLSEKIVYSRNGDTFILSLGDLLFLENYFKSIDSKFIIDENILNWSRREGEEYYFYGDLPSILVGFIENSIRLENSPIGSYSGLTLLAPIESKYIPRKKYISVLECHFEPDEEGFDCSCLEGKRIIHFEKLPVEIGFNKIIDFFYNDEELDYNKQIRKMLANIEQHIRDYISRSLEFNRDFKNLLSSHPFIRDILILDDEIESLKSSEKIAAIEGTNLILVGRIATKKEPFRIYFKDLGYTIINLTDILAKEISKDKPTRRDLFFGGKEIKEKYGPNILARKAVDYIFSNKIRNFLILGCRSPKEIEYIKDKLPDVIVMGLFPDSNKILAQLKSKYPDADQDSYEKWIDWNDGKESDGYTNIKMCMQMCDLLFNDIK